MELVKDPVPLPLDVLLPPVVGLAEVLQHTPLAVTEAPPSDVTFPPLEAEVDVILDAVAVVTVGAALAVVKVLSAPYEVPTLFLAYAREW